MKSLINAGTYEIITPKEQLAYQLLNIEHAGRVAYQSETEPVTLETAKDFIANKIMKRGHESVIEHSSLIIRFDNISRGFTHEMVRHRLAGYTQESTRYANPGDLNFVFPPHRDSNEPIQVNDTYSLTPVEMVEIIQDFYGAMIKAGWAKQDARQILPIGTKSQIVVSANFREWRHIFKMRTAKSAHWEIRRVMCNLLTEIKTIVPVIFDDFEAQYKVEDSVVGEVNDYIMIPR